MVTEYFKHRGRFDYKPHHYEVGSDLIQFKTFEDNFYLLNLYEISEFEYSDYYRYHLDYFLETNPDKEEAFFTHVRDIVNNKIEELGRKSSLSPFYGINKDRIRRLQAFKLFLTTVDQWRTDQSKDTIIANQEEEILSLKLQLAEKKLELKKARKLETKNQIMILQDHFHVVIDLFNQMQDLRLPNGRELMIPNAQSVFEKMLCKNFTDGRDKAIEFETVRRYFKPSGALPEYKLFNIVPVNKSA